MLDMGLSARDFAIALKADVISSNCLFRYLMLSFARWDDAEWVGNEPMSREMPWRESVILATMRGMFHEYMRQLIDSVSLETVKRDSVSSVNTALLGFFFPLSGESPLQVLHALALSAQQRKNVRECCKFWRTYYVGTELGREMRDLQHVTSISASRWLEMVNRVDALAAE